VGGIGQSLGISQVECRIIVLFFSAVRTAEALTTAREFWQAQLPRNFTRWLDRQGMRLPAPFHSLSHDQRSSGLRSTRSPDGSSM